mmetsp:Transcript_12012/g.26901  ORF Transcript_12012/g.26901 Transcript_12012/m.26901 type:complete len:291 (+) Transcript_12012:519-1391(+)
MTLLLVDVQATNGPVSLGEVLRVPRDKLLARHCLGGFGTTPGEIGIAQVPAKVETEDQAHVLQVTRRTQRRIECEVGVRPTPKAGLRVAVHKISWLAAHRPVPSADAIIVRVPLRCIGAAALSIEDLTQGVVRARLRATLVLELVRGVDVAAVSSYTCGPQLPVRGEIRACLDIRLVTAFRRMQGGDRVPNLVHALDDVELAPCGPDVVSILAIHPEGGPHATPRRGMADAYDEKARVVGLLGLYPHRSSAFLMPMALVHLNAQVSPLRRGLCQAIPLRLFLVYVVHEPV